MARITVEDCLKQQNNRFELTLLAAKRARHLVMSGQDPLVPWENDKPTVVALREIAEGLITAEIMKQQESSRYSETMDAQAMLAQAASRIAQVDEFMEAEAAALAGEEDEEDLEVKSPAAESSNVDEPDALGED